MIELYAVFHTVHAILLTDRYFHASSPHRGNRTRFATVLSALLDPFPEDARSFGLYLLRRDFPLGLPTCPLDVKMEGTPSERESKSIKAQALEFWLQNLQAQGIQHWPSDSGTLQT